MSGDHGAYANLDTRGFGDIGYHHVHHLSPKIPNCRLKECYDAVPALQAKAPLTIARSLPCVWLKMWDEERPEMIAFP